VPLFLADQNIPRLCVRRLREAGYDVESVAEQAPGASDPDVMASAGRAGRILLTEDRDFGDLIYARRQPSPPGVVYLRLGSDPPGVVADALLRVLSSEREFVGWFTTVSGSGRVRQRPLPPG
jgi:predicted nuclease of predicted toxin-antitoxin system